MRKFLFLLTIMSWVATSSYSQVHIYKLLDKTSNADINYKKLNLLNKQASGYILLNKVFKPKKGDYTVYRFLATFKGLSHETENEKIFHDIIVIKTDKQSKIIDAYQYTLEWAEEPFTTDLYKLSTKGLSLKNHLDLKTLNFRQVVDPSDEQQKLKILHDQGYLQF